MAIRQRVHERRNIYRTKLQAIKTATPCADCDLSYPPYMMDFDHVRGVKKFCLGHNLARVTSMQALLDEVAKCDVVCANCHRHRTFLRSLKARKAKPRED